MHVLCIIPQTHTQWSSSYWAWLDMGMASPPQPEDPSPPPTATSTLSSMPELVRRQLTRLHSGKAAGPDGVFPRVLKACALQLCVVLSQVFSLSLHLQRVPVL